MTVRVAVTQERHAGETRVAATPETVKKLTHDNAAKLYGLN